MASMLDELNRALARAWEEGKCAASRGVRNNPYLKPWSDREPGDIESKGD